VMREAIFGSFDGLVSALGVIAAAYLVGNAHLLVTAAAGLAIAAAVSMAGGAFLSEPTYQKGEAKRAGVMALATFVGAFLPAVPFLFFAKPVALIGTLVLVIAASTAIAQARVPTHGYRRAYLQTLVILVVASGLSIGMTLLFNVTG
jgi:VIT1/CCC1 family predicted Fe2+/Mn2+ transporter